MREEIALKMVLKTIENQFKGKDYIVELFTDELTSICPFTNLPDFYRLVIRYKPKEKLIELKSFKIYLLQFRNKPTTHESLLNVIFEDLREILDSLYLYIELDANIRGGIKVKVQRVYEGVKNEKS